MENVVPDFLAACAEWLCDGYALDIRYVGNPKGAGHVLWNGAITLLPLPATQDNGLRLSLPGVVAGQLQQPAISRDAALALIAEAAGGKLPVHDMSLLLPTDGSFQRQSTLGHRDLWSAKLILQTLGAVQSPQSPDVFARIDHSLRTADPPFDGLTDLGSWLALGIPEFGHERCGISITVNPPLAIGFEESQLSNDRLRITLHAHPHLDVSSIGLSVRFVPGGGLVGRRKVADKIEWSDARDGRRVGVADIEGTSADTALVMLMLGPVTVQRQWFIDPERAANHRLLAVQHFDNDLKMIRRGLFDSAESSKFETAVAALFFLLGFSAAVQLETDAPDLLVTTPGRRLVIVECTVRVADIATKVGKLVDRRASIVKVLKAANHPLDVSAVLVCRQSKEQIAAHSDQLSAHKVILVAAEELSEALNRVRFPSDPDEMLSQALHGLSGPASGAAPNAT